MNDILTSPGFLRIGGTILLILGWLGYLLAPISGGALLGDFWWFSGGENFAHATLGVLALVFAADLTSDWQKAMAAIVGIVSLLFGVYGFTLPAGTMESLNTWGVANLENPLDNLLHLVVGVWALWAAFAPGAAAASG